LLSVTERAAAMIHDLIVAKDLPEGSGLRIAQRDDHTALAMSLSVEPGSDDTVLEEAPIFLGPIAAHRTTDATLDAKATETTHAFYLR
jgi:hypothetical protein